MFTMFSCMWARRRIQRYLDADPAALLSPQEVSRLQAHLQVCQRCGEVAEDYRGLGRALDRWSTRRAPDPAAMERMQQVAEELLTGDAGGPGQ